MNMKWLGVPAAAAAAIGLWVTLGFPTLATSENLANHAREEAAVAEKRDKRQTDTAVDVYKNKVTLYLLFPEPESPVQRQFLRELLDEAKRELQAAEDRKIELSK